MCARSGGVVGVCVLEVGVCVCVCVCATSVRGCRVVCVCLIVCVAE